MFTVFIGFYFSEATPITSSRMRSPNPQPSATVFLDPQWEPHASLIPSGSPYWERWQVPSPALMAVEVMSGDGADPQGWAPQASVKQMAGTTCGGWNHLRVRLLTCAGWLIYIRLRHKGLPTVGRTVPWAEAPECRGRRQWAEPKHSSFSAPWLWRPCGLTFCSHGFSVMMDCTWTVSQSSPLQVALVKVFYHSSRDSN